ncbi:hypothetical protein [Xenophilus sp. Marseille-Q4582]|uniref:hypothetical protein n=1 Tax=Xenophilus sp. Marseille-Q4582 TaxID=2866600 RepID=UPI001CE44B93|nr:hypothetical protein [Xenophilus sp. Marseille-Q4582]
MGDIRTLADLRDAVYSLQKAVDQLSGASEPLGERSIELRPGESLTFADGTRVFVRCADGDADQPAATDPSTPPPIFGGVRNMRVFGEKGPELEATAPSRLYSKGELIADIRRARQELAAIQSRVEQGRSEAAEIDPSAGASIPADQVPTLADVLAELRAARALLERQTAVLAWSQLLQRDPFSPSQLDPAQAAQEAHSTALAARSTASGLDLARVDSLSPSVRTPGSPSVGSAQEARE